MDRIIQLSSIHFYDIRCVHSLCAHHSKSSRMIWLWVVSTSIFFKAKFQGLNIFYLIYSIFRVQNKFPFAIPRARLGYEAGLHTSVLYHTLCACSVVPSVLTPSRIYPEFLGDPDTPLVIFFKKGQIHLKSNIPATYKGILQS